MGRDDRELLDLLAEGWSQRAIAGSLGLSVEELRALVRGVFDRLGVAGASPAATAQLLLLDEALRSGSTDH